MPKVEIIHRRKYTNGTKEGQRDHLQGLGRRLRLPFASADDLIVDMEKSIFREAKAMVHF